MADVLSHNETCPLSQELAEMLTSVSDAFAVRAALQADKQQQRTQLAGPAAGKRSDKKVAQTIQYTRPSQYRKAVLGDLAQAWRKLCATGATGTRSLTSGNSGTAGDPVAAGTSKTTAPQAPVEASTAGDSIVNVTDSRFLSTTHSAYHATRQELQLRHESPVLPESTCGNVC